MQDEKEILILETANQLYMRYGIKSISMDDLGRELGMSKKTIYQFYTDKTELVQKSMQYFLDKHKTDLDAILNQRLNAIDEMFSINEIVCGRLKSIQPTVFFDLQKYYPKSWKAIQFFKNDYIKKTINGNIAKGIKEGLYRTNINPEIIATLHSHNVELMTNSENALYQKYLFNDIHSEIMRYHIRGLASQKGLNYLSERLKSQSTNKTKHI